MKYKQKTYNVPVIFKITPEMNERLNRAVKKEKSTKSILCRSALDGLLSIIFKD